VKIISRAPVPLEGASKTEFVVFRGGEGLRDQVAIIVGSPDLAGPVAVRLHSACLTGDLFGSLKCDCGDQLRDTVRHMAEGEGGILLYLDQEGRGNGIANKIRAYKLQAQGYDTYDADEMLGFDQDQRRFEFAAEMLAQLGVKSVRIMTNNPVKIEALAKAGLDVVSEERVMGRPTAENVRYLASKRDRAGHYIDLDPLADGNGRTSRALSYIVLSVKLDSLLPGTKTIPDQIADDKTPYYDALEKADALWKANGDVDVSALEHMLSGMLATQLLQASKDADAAPSEDHDVKVRGEALSVPIHWKGRQWAVTARGIEARDGTYAIAAHRLWEDEGVWGWEKHMAEKEWVDMDDFRAAITEARKRYGHLKPTG
jgi:GTP cyclohydrolase II